VADARLHSDRGLREIRTLRSPWSQSAAGATGRLPDGTQPRDQLRSLGAIIKDAQTFNYIRQFKAAGN